MHHTFRISSPNRPDLPAKLVLGRGAGESARHILLKLCGWLLFWRPGLMVERSAEQHYKPDLLLEGDSSDPAGPAAAGQPVLWIDCGVTTIRKLDRVATKNHHALIVIIKSEIGELRRYHAMADGKVRRMERVGFLAFERGFIAALERSLGHVNDLSFGAELSAPAPSMELTLNGTPHRTALHVLPGPERFGWGGGGGAGGGEGTARTKKRSSEHGPATDGAKSR
jgi:hypothetical protein